MRNNIPPPLTPNGSTKYSPDTHKLLEKEYAEAHARHLRCREAANAGLRDLRAAERRLQLAAKEFVNYTALKLALDTGKSFDAEAERVLRYPTGA